MMILASVLFLQVPAVPDMKRSFAETAKLLEQMGVSVPAGSVYCEATAAFRSSEIGGSRLRAKGWALPAQKGQPRMFLTVDGLTAFMGQVLSRPNLEADARAAYAARWLPGRASRGLGSTSYLSSSDLGLALIYLSGERELASELILNRPLRIKPFSVGALTPILMEQLSPAFEAFTKGEDALAKRKLESILRNRAQLESDVIRASAGQWELFTSRSTKPVTPFPCLDPAAELYADLQRRQPRKFDLGNPIGNLISKLEDVRGEQFVWPGTPSYEKDPTAQALIAAGPAAVEPLLECIENDKRLSRALRRGFDSPTSVVPVAKVARALLAEILQVPISESAKTADLRAIWAANQNFSPAERSFNLLKDEKAQGDWYDAVLSLLTPKEPGGVLPAATLPSSAKALIAKRIGQLFQTRHLFDVLKRFEKLDADLASEVGLSYLRYLMSEPLEKQSSTDAPNFAKLVRSVTHRRGTAILPEIAAWLRKTEALPQLPDSAPYFYVISAFPNEAGMREVLQGLLTSPSRKFDLPDIIDRLPEYRYETFLASPLLKFEEFRSLAVEALQKERTVGSVDVTGTVVRRIFKAREWHESRASEPEASGSTVALRTCDLVASALAEASGTEFRTYWAAARKEAAIEAMIGQLKTNTFPIPTAWPGDYGPDRL